MTIVAVRRRLLATTMIGGLALGAGLWSAPAFAQTSSAAAAPDAKEVGEIVVTGTRIKRTDTDTAAPVTMVDSQTITAKGFTAAGQVLNDLTSNVPQVAEAAGSGSAAGNGQTFPNLFGLGAGRTLTLVNGRRMVTTSSTGAGSGLGDRIVDTNVIPIGLVRRVDVVQAGGAAVYGSDAIAGVINYILQDRFEGVELDAQYGQSTYGDYNTPFYRATAGKNFAGGRGNIAADIEWSKTDPLLDYDRPRTNLGRVTVANAANTGPNDGIPSVRENLNTRFWEFNYNGILFSPAPAPVAPFILSSGGVPQQVNPAGNGLIPYNLGVTGGIPFNSGGDGLPYQELASLYVGIERLNGNLIGHYDITDHMKVSGELLISHTRSRDPYQVLLSNTVLNSAATGSGAIPISRSNPFLPAGVAPGGPPLFLSKAWAAGDLTPTREGNLETDTIRGLLSLDGDFNYAERNFYYSVSFSHAENDGDQRAWGVNTTRFNNAVQAVKTSAGSIVCGINADASTANDDPNCVPINPFGVGNVTPQARAYIDLLIGQEYLNTQDDFLATLGGDIVTLPAGKAKFSVGYEHRSEFAKYTPFIANQQGLTGSQVKTLATRGSYHTDELSAEVLVPVIGGDYTLPFAKLVELDGQYRLVDNSIAGQESVWGVGGRWQPVEGVTIRASRSRNFRAPTLDQLFAPSSTALNSIGNDPCDFRFINNGPAVATRQANCLALFQANPLYGTGGSGGAAVGSSAATRLSTFQDPSANFANALVTVGGNPSLKNEISDTTTYGIVLQPSFAPGLSIVIDRIEIDLTNGLSPFTPQNFEETCFDSSPQPTIICGTFTRDATGAIVTAKQTTFNAGQVEFRGEVYNATYQFPISRFFPGHDYGTAELNVEATHTSKLEQSVTGFDRTDFAGSLVGLGGAPNPDWVVRFDARWSMGPFRALYEMYYLPSIKQTPTATIESTPTPIIGSNTRHSISAQYDLPARYFGGQYTLRAGIINLTNEEPSYPTRNYGDILGRQYYVGLRARF
jgi:outer membrane receptor protein involved in Fe transport